MATLNASITHLTVSADDVLEAVQFAVGQLQVLTVERGARGFTAPELTQESMELIDGKWARVFEFSAEFLPEVSRVSA